MRPLTIKLPDGRDLAARAWQTESTFERAQGWLKRDSVSEGEGLMICPCNSIHTFGMRFRIDAVFLDRHGKVLSLKPEIRPGRFAWGPFFGLLLPWTVQVLELPGGTLKGTGLAPGQQLQLIPREVGA